MTAMKSAVLLLSKNNHAVLQKNECFETHSDLLIIYLYLLFLALRFWFPTE